MIPTVKAYKEDGRWFIDDDNGFTKNQNELVAGIPEIIEFIAGTDAEKVKIEYSDKPFKGAEILTLIHTDVIGSTYQYVDKWDYVHEGWLCPVFFWYFMEPPKKLYVKITKA